MNDVVTNKVRLIYGALVASAVLIPIKSITHPCTSGVETVSAGDLFKSAGLSFMLAAWMTSLALSLIVVSGKEGLLKTQIFWILATTVILGFFGYTIYQDTSLAVMDVPMCSL